MSSYHIVARLDIQYNEENIHNILKKGTLFGGSFFTYIWGELNIHCPPIKNLFDAAKTIIIGDDNDLHCVVIRMQDTYFNLNFINNNGYISLMIVSFSYPWLKKFEDGSEDIDIGKYAQIMLDLIEDYKILEMRIEKD